MERRWILGYWTAVIIFLNHVYGLKSCNYSMDFSELRSPLDT